MSEKNLEELRVKVAELLGARWGFPVFGHDLKWHTHFAFQPFEFDSTWAGNPPAFELCEKEYDIPDYPSDLNACANFERDVLHKDVKLYLDYARKLSATHGALDAIFATAEQRCRAFIATMEKGA